MQSLGKMGSHCSTLAKLHPVMPGAIQDYVVSDKATAASGKYCGIRIASWQKKCCTGTSSLCRFIFITSMKLFSRQFSQKE
jgi:hypothetical protein